MKDTSIKKLSAVYAALKDLGDYAYCADLIQEVIRAESTQVKGKKFNFYNFTSKDECRETITGVYHEKGFRVATDAHIMVAIKSDYPADYEGRILKKDGSFVSAELKYPKWESVVPDIAKDGFRAYHIEPQKFYDWIESQRAAHKAEYAVGVRFGDLWRVNIVEAWFKAEFFDRFLTAMKELGCEEVWIKDGRRPMVAKSEKGVCLLMPMLKEEEDRPTVKLA